MEREASELFEEFKELTASEFFRRNKQMLGFSGKIRSLTMVFHELITNSLDAAEEAGIQPGKAVLPDFIICGERATDGDTGQVGPGIASFLDLPVVSYVGKIESVEGGKVRVHRLVEDGHELLECDLPAVLTVIKEVASPRLPTLGGKLKAKREIRVASLFKQAPAPFLKMIVVHELAHLKELEHDKAFYQLCRHMEPAYHQLEFDLRAYLSYLDATGQPLWAPVAADLQ